MDAVSVDWSTAQVDGDTVTVRLAGEQPKGWKQSFRLTVTLLAADTPFTDASLKRDTVSISGVRPGDEDTVRFLIEGAVQQSNADHPAHADDEEPGEDTAPRDAARDDPQEEMTERLRGFAAGDGAA